MPKDERAELVARMFHEAYERLAPQFSYETRKASAVPWEDVPENNRKLMIATVAEVLAALEPQAETVTRLREALVEARGFITLHGQHDCDWHKFLAKIDAALS